MFSISFIVSPRCPPPFIICSNSSIDSTSISATSIQYRSAQKSVMTRIFGMPLLAPIRFIAKNFSTIGRTLPGLQNMISRTRNMEVSRVGSVRRQQTVPASRTLNNDGSAITQNLGGRPLAAHLRTLVSDSHNRIRPEFASVLEEQFVSLLTRLLAHLRVRPDLSTDNLLQSSKEPLADRRGSHNDAADETLVFRNAISLNGEGGRCQQRLGHPGSWIECRPARGGILLAA